MSNKLFFQSELIPKEYRDWFEAQFFKALHGGKNIAMGGSPISAVEKVVDEFKEENEKIKELEAEKEAEKEPEITKE